MVRTTATGAAQEEGANEQQGSPQGTQGRVSPPPLAIGEAGSPATGGEGSPAPVGATPSAPPVGVGLYNQGATCYMNSLLQLFFHIPYFREAVYRMTTSETDESDIPKAMQNLFFQMQEKKTAVSTKCLTDAFGWDEREVFIQHDIQELAAKLRDTLETRMKGTPAEGALHRMFTGYGARVTTTLDRSYTSRMKDEFYDVHIPVRDYSCLEDSLKSNVAKEQLVGGNQYKVEEEGKPAVYKDAETGYEFSRFPPVALFHLKRFEMDMASPTLDMKKLNTPLEFPTTLNLTPYEHSTPELFAKCQLKPLSDANTRGFSTDFTADTDLAATVPDEAIYDLYGVIVHKGGVRSGHYYAFIREYDAASGTWRRWLKYDDDEVTEVDQLTAVDKNFGGYIYTYHNGKQLHMLQNHSAYILAYMRRSDLAKLLYPISTNAIPPHVKLELERVMKEEERLQAEELERNSLITFHLVNDDTIRNYVSQFTAELLPSINASPTCGAFLSISMKKTQTLAQLYQALRERNIGGVRLWRWAQTFDRGCPRVSVALPLLSGTEADESSLWSLIPHQATDEHKAWSEVLYVEYPRAYTPPMVTNVLSEVSNGEVSTNTLQRSTTVAETLKLGGAFKFDPADRNPTLTAELKKALPITHLQLKLVNPSKINIDFEVTILFAIYDKDPQGADSRPVWEFRRVVRCLGNYNSIFVEVPVESRKEGAQGVVGKWVLLSRVELVPVARAHVLPFYFQKFTIHSSPEAIPHLQPTSSPTPVLPEYDSKTTTPAMIKLFNHRLKKLIYLGMIFLQTLDPIRNCNPTLKTLLQQNGINPDPKHRYIFWDESRPHPLDKLDDRKSPQDAKIFNGNILTIQVDPAQLPVVYRFLQADQFYAFVELTRMINVHDVKQPNHPRTSVTIPMQGDWRFSQITDAIGAQLNVDPEYIRLYAPGGYHQPGPKSEPERSDRQTTLDKMIGYTSWPVYELYYEILSIKVKDAEQTLTVPLRFASIMGEPLSEEIVVNTTISASLTTLVEGFLKAVGETIVKPHCLETGNSFVIIERSHHLISTWHPVRVSIFGLPTPKVDFVDEFGDPLPQEVQAKHLERTFTNFTVSLDTFRKGFTYEIRPYIIPRLEELAIPCGFGDQTLPSHSQPHGTPFLFNIGKQESCRSVKERLLVATGLKEEDLESVEQHFEFMIYTYCLMSLPDFRTTLQAYMSGSPKSEYHPTHAMLHRKKPKEKPGSRYIPQNEPQLVLEKKKLQQSKSSDNVASAAATAVPASAVAHAASAADVTGVN